MSLFHPHHDLRRAVSAERADEKGSSLTKRRAVDFCRVATAVCP
jgi:hypothetical protein